MPSNMYEGKTLEERIGELIKLVTNSVTKVKNDVTGIMDGFRESLENMILNKVKYNHVIYGDTGKFNQDFIDSLKDGDHVLVKKMVTISEPLKIDNSHLTIEFTSSSGITIENWRSDNNKNLFSISSGKVGNFIVGGRFVDPSRNGLSMIGGDFGKNKVSMIYLENIGLGEFDLTDASVIFQSN